ncbi:GIY-YIG nuclease family protein [Calidifontibacter indicus]|uniref:GIY-YIG nuclease family protein n=1 Tax=Calidifontibacter indicus TaxID=419650 RepID=UPI001B8733E5|nr:GIY-YIG nuclease family protein [Calidifontibacter indicus]
MNGKQVKLFLVDGTPGGLTTAEITNWTGHVLSARRSDLADLLRREEAERTGVYLLLGEDETAVGDTRCYFGEADVVAARLRSHAKDKAFWNQVVVITSKDTNLTKSHGRYLESRLIELATQAGRVTVENGTAPADTSPTGSGRVRHAVLPRSAPDRPACVGSERDPGSLGANRRCAVSTEPVANLRLAECPSGR